jgi:hypothetical protein
MSKGSILGYSEARLGDFSFQDSILIKDMGRLLRTPSAGWFEVEPLSAVSVDSTYNPNALLNKFGSRFGVSSLKDIYPYTDPLTAQKALGRKYYSIYSAYLFTPDIPIGQTSLFDTASQKGIKLYKNPMRSLPYFLIRNTEGSKEFVICVVGRGKHFKEPRAMISCFSTNYKYVWDKIPPHFAW